MFEAHLLQDITLSAVSETTDSPIIHRASSAASTDSTHEQEELSHFRRNMIASTGPEGEICNAYVGAESPGRCFMLDDAIAVIAAEGW